MPDLLQSDPVLEADLTMIIGVTGDHTTGQW